MHLSRSDHALSVRLLSLTFHIFDFFSEAAERNSMKLDRKEDLNVLYYFCVFFSGRSDKNKDGRPGLWFAETFSTSPLNPLNGIQRNSIDRKEDYNVLDKVCNFRADRKNKMATGPLTGGGIFDFSSETAEWNLTKLVWKQDINVIYQSLCFSGKSENQDGHPGQSIKKWHIVLRCTICGPLGPLLFETLNIRCLRWSSGMRAGRQTGRSTVRFWTIVWMQWD